MTELAKILELHAKYLAGEDGGELADFTNANLRHANLRHANLRHANLRGADFRGANLNKANLTGSDLRGADLNKADLRHTNFENADLSGADLQDADLKGAYLADARLTQDQVAYLRCQVLSKFEKNSKGNYIAYKTFGWHQKGKLPEGWILKQRRIIEEPNIERSDRVTCGPGINVATLDWVHEFRRSMHTLSADIWKVELLCDPVVPLASDGKIRCEKVKLTRIVK